MPTLTPLMTMPKNTFPHAASTGTHHGMQSDGKLPID